VILVTGSTGRIGQDVAFGLVLADVQFRVIIHNGTGAEWQHWSNVETVMGDFAKPATLDLALEGISAAFLVSRPGPDQVQLESNFIDACVRAGVGHVVKVSALGAALDAPCRFHVRHRQIEEKLLASGIRTTILRPNQFMQNLLASKEAIAPPVNRLIGSLNPATQVRVVDTSDVAEIAVKKLFSTGTESETIEISGPQPLTQPDICAALSRLLDRPIAYDHREPAAYAELLQGAGVSADVADGIVELHEWQDGGGGAGVSEASADRLGRPARTLDDFLKRLGKHLI